MLFDNELFSRFLKIRIVFKIILLLKKLFVLYLFVFIGGEMEYRVVIWVFGIYLCKKKVYLYFIYGVFIYN